LRVVSRLVDSLVQTFKVPDGIYVEAKKQFSDEELIDITQLIGVYTAVAMMVGLIRPELDRYRRSSSFTTGAA
jgi:alkylhydroperoxidase family enzyme